jgi:choline kinase
MKALIMAAGVGSRISRHLHERPKCCVDVGGKPLIRYTFELLFKMGIADVAIVTGYQESYIIQALDGLKYTRYFNPFYRITNSIASVWRAQDFLTGLDDIMVMNGDVFIEEKVLEIVLNDARSPVMYADSSRIKEADYRFQW